jgi:hypothetical protein
MRSEARGVGVTGRGRILSRAALCLLFGLLTTLGVAWTSAAFETLDTMRREQGNLNDGDTRGMQFMSQHYQGWGAERVVWALYNTNSSHGVVGRPCRCPYRPAALPEGWTLSVVVGADRP